MSTQKVGVTVLLIGIVGVAFFIRIQGIPTVPPGQFTSNDGYFYYWQAQLIAENGHLPARDMHRWPPLGRDLGQTLNLYGYLLAYTHRAIGFCFPQVTLYHVTIYAPVICFCIGLAVLCLFFSRAFGLAFSSMVGVLLATLPGTIDRSAAGFGDRDSWCWLLGVLAITTYLASLAPHSRRKRLGWTFASGFFVVLGGVSWEGFGVFLSIILCVELWRFLTTETEEGLGYYLLWVLIFVPTLYLASPAYRVGYGFAKHLFALMLMPPLVLLLLRTLRYFVLMKADKCRPHARSLSLGLTLASLVLGLGYIFLQRHTFADTTVPFSQNALMQTVGELKNPLLVSWMLRYGSVFVLGCLGIAMAVLRFWKVQGVIFAAPLVLFTLTTFYRTSLDKLWGTLPGNMLFGVAIASCIVGFIVLAWRRQSTAENEPVYIAFIVWLLFWGVLARDARRYDFFIGVPISFFTTDLILFIATFYGNQVKQRLPQILLKTGITVTMLLLIMFWNPVGGHANRAVLATTHLRRAIPGNGSVSRTFNWIKENLPGTAVVAANWSHGSQLNVLAGVKTIIDQDHYLQHWIHLYNRYVSHAENERDVLEFLKSHTATHLMLTEKEPPESFLRGHLSDAFVPVYPRENFTDATVKIWELRYPPDIKPHPKYLETEPPQEKP